MEITLSKDVLEGLPSPDSQGLVRVSIGLKVKDGGKASIVEINDVPMGDDEEEKEPPAQEEAPMPSPDDIASQIMG